MSAPEVPLSALSPSEWERAELAFDMETADGIAANPAQALAFANDMLEDADPRKITWATVATLRRSAEALREESPGVGDEWRRMDAGWHNLAGRHRARHEALALALETLARILATYLRPEAHR